MPNIPIIIVTIAIVSTVILTPLGRLLESALVTHVLIELPLLVISGLIFGTQFRPYCNHIIINRINLGGILGLILASFLLAFWMIPRWLDASINHFLIAYVKYGTMFSIGIMLSLSWPRAHFITRAVIKIEFLTMLYRLGWIYLIAPERLCNNYLLNEQILLGRGLLFIALALTISWSFSVLFWPVISSTAIGN